MILLLKAFVKKFPNDSLDILCSASSDLQQLAGFQNINVFTFSRTRFGEFDRLMLGFKYIDRIAKKRQADVVWSLNLGMYFKTNLPQVLSVQNAHQVYPWDFARYHPGNKLHLACLRRFFRRSLKVSDGVIVQTPIMREYVKNTHGSPGLIEVVPKAVENLSDLDFRSLPSSLRNRLSAGQYKNRLTLLYVSTFIPHKNHLVLVKALKILSLEKFRVRVIFTIRPDALISLAGKEAKKLIEKGYILPVGWIEKEHLKALYDYCDACLMPSLLESLSSAYLEAMQWGKPQIVSDLRFARDVCSNSAIYADPEDAADWADKIKRLNFDLDLRFRLKTAGHARIKSFPPTWADVSAKIHRFLEKVVSFRSV